MEQGKTSKFYRHGIKRGLDLIVAISTFLVLLPFLILLVILLFFANKGEVFFIQRRPGLNSKLFKIIKFKTMNDLRDADGKLLPDSERLTQLGKIIRKASIDEIPQLLNIIKGDMSLVGPRPLRVEYLPLYNEFQHRRHEVRPGITGWAQVNGRNTIGWEEKFEYDVYYVDHLSFQLDMRILWLTVKKVVRSEGISQDGHATMPFFKGVGKQDI